MSFVAGRTFAACLLPVFGLFLIFFGFIASLTTFPGDVFFPLVSQIMFYAGILMILVGVGLVPGARTEMNKRRKVVEIVSVRKQVTISEISQETGLDREYILDLLTKLLVAHFIFGYIEDDLFVRDTSGRRPIYGGRMGMFGT